MKRVLVATGNIGKIRELKALLGEGVEVLSLSDVGLDGAAETGTTFEENALLKAEQAARATGMVAVADDSGIAVDILDGAPGVWSARYSDPDATDARNRDKLLRALAATPDDGRTARFVSVIAVVAPDGASRTFLGTLEGCVARSERGTGGFGYDSIFELADGRTVAELPADEKNRISHRGMALRNALPYIHSLLADEA
jgi:XTP/dITP diphosphohydrolase